MGGIKNGLVETHTFLAFVIRPAVYPQACRTATRASLASVLLNHPPGTRKRHPQNGCQSCCRRKSHFLMAPCGEKSLVAKKMDNDCLSKANYEPPRVQHAESEAEGDPSISKPPKVSPVVYDRVPEISPKSCL